MSKPITLNEKLPNLKFIILGVVLGVGFWFFDALVDSLFIKQRPYLTEVLHPDNDCLYYRLSVFAISIFSGFYFQRTFNRLKAAEEVLKRNQEELEEKVFERTAELRTTNELLSVENFHRKEAEILLNSSVHRLLTLLEAIPDAVYFKDTDSRYIVVNKAAEKMLGKSSDDIIGRTDASLMPPDLLACCRKSDEKTFAGKVPVFTEAEFRNEKGEVLYWESTKIPILNEAGDAVGLVGVSRDVTSRKRADAALIEERNKSAAILNNIPDIAWLKDRESRFIAVNEPFGRACGLKPADLVGKTDLDIWPAALAERYRKDDREVMASGQRKVVEEPLDDQEGRISWLETIKIPIYDEQGMIIGTTGIARDITARKKMEEEAQRHKDQLEGLIEERTYELVRMYDSLQKEMEERLRMEEKVKQLHGMKVVGELAAGVAHEVRNPLHAILSITEALKQELKDNPDFDIYLSHINTQVKRLALLMQDLLELGKPLDKDAFREESIEDICTSVISLCRDIPGIQDHPIVFVPASGDRISVWGDARKLQQVFINLIENAAQHSPAGSDIMVTVFGPHEQMVRVAVKDQGYGIPEDLLPRIYDPFFSTRRKGVGLGLNIVKNIVEFHGGSLELRNNSPLTGCTATVFLPRSRGNGS